MSVNEKRSFSDSRAGPPSTSEPVAKKICRENNSIESASVENDNSSNEPTILDMLNEHCWIAVFQYIHIQDLINTEYVSKQWRRMVLSYLQGIRVSLRHMNYKHEYVNRWFEHPMKSRIVYIPFYDLDDIVKKLGRSVVATFCTDPGEIDTIAKYCPDIKDLKIIPIQQKEKRLDFREHRTAELKKLKRVHLHSPIYFRDGDIGCLFASPVLEELVVDFNRKITGRCLKSLRSQLKYLRLDNCKKLNVGNLVSSRHLHDLIKLGLNRNSTATLKNVHKLIEKTPKLECLTLEAYEYPTDVGGLVNAICRLSHLTHLSFLWNINVRDDWLEPIGRCCKALRNVNVGSCSNVTAAGVLALCRGAGNTLITLDVSFNHNIFDDDVASIISACPKLERLAVQYGECLTPELPAVAAATLAATAPRPRLWLGFLLLFNITEPMENTADLRLDCSEHDEPTVWDHHYLETIQDTRASGSNYEMLYLESSRGLKGYKSDVRQKLKAMTRKRIKKTRASYKCTV